ncbi:hypothetical protein OS493_009650 [Desmophyllum pertusum]|uniref:Uncharacterized protein n=1 Tax=Desmophyllum pertusum TaxID=174260 RepID=A0A9W9YR32_9CNID|nr:hypothetical protein OS493_009650 [Desmophyllum pertusum]
MTTALLAHDIDGALVDNYVIAHSLNLIQDEPIRIERYIDHANHFMEWCCLKIRQSSRRCLRQFLHNHPHETFEIIAAYLCATEESKTDDREPSS